MFAVRIKTDKPKIDWSNFVKAKKEVEYVTSGSLLEQALYEFMEREGWDFENERFIDFDDDDEIDLKLKPKHTHIDPTSIEESVNLAGKRKPELQEPEQKPPFNPGEIEENAVSVSCVDTEQTMFLKIKNASNEQLYTYAFCKVFENMLEVHYEQIEQLSIPFFKSKDERAIKNKPNILIANQCIVRTNRSNYKTIPTGIQRYITENSHLEDILKEKVNLDFLEALKP